MKRRAEGLDETRNRIVWATMQLHSEKGVTSTTQADVAARAGVAPATVYRHFPTMGSLVRACGRQVWMALSPPGAGDADRLFAGLRTTRERLHTFVEEVTEFYGRGWLTLESARQERRWVPELDEELLRVESGLQALAREALALDGSDEPRVQLLMALTDFGVWQSFRDHNYPNHEAAKVMAALIECVLIDASQADPE